MSVHIRCDRCSKDTAQKFFNVKIGIERGGYASVNSKLSPGCAGTPWRREWQLCESCTRSLQSWSEPPPEEAQRV